MSDINDVIIPRITIGVFCESDSVSATLAQAFADRRMGRVKATISEGGIDSAISKYSEAPPPNLIVIESRAGRDSLLAKLEALAAECVSGTRVIVIGNVNDVSLYRELIDRGVDEYVVTPFMPADFIACVARVYRGAEAKSLGKITAFIGARGGVGSSTVAHHMAAVISELYEQDIYLVDFDLPLGTVNLDFNIDASTGTVEFLDAGDKADHVLLDRLSSKRGERLHILSAPSSFERAYDPSPESCEHFVETARLGAGHVILDLPCLWADWARRLLVAADTIVITAVPDLTSMRNAKRMAEFLARARPNDPKPLLIMNQLGVPKRPEIKTEEFVTAVGLPAAAELRFESQIFGKAANNGQTIFETAPKSLPAKTFRTLASSAPFSGKRTVRTSRSRLPYLGKIFGRAIS